MAISMPYALAPMLCAGAKRYDLAALNENGFSRKIHRAKSMRTSGGNHYLTPIEFSNSLLVPLGYCAE
ncbi:MAG: hypothetical protein ACPG5T_00900, partial [Endozoicomonas sp.]